MPPPPTPQNELSLVPNISKTTLDSGVTGPGTETSGILRENGKEEAKPQLLPSPKNDASPNIAWSLPTPPLKQRMASGFKSLFESAKKLATGDNGDANSGPAAPHSLFPKTAPAVDGEDCDHDCDSCTVKYPKSFSIDTEDVLYGHVKGWSTHLLVATGKTDWVRDVADEKGSVMQAVEASDKPDNGVSFFLFKSLIFWGRHIYMPLVTTYLLAIALLSDIHSLLIAVPTAGYHRPS